MPGNETIEKSPKAFLPVSWKKEGFTSGQATGVAMEIAGSPLSIVEFTLLRKTSLRTVGIKLTQGVSAGFVRFEITKNGSPTGKTVDMDSAAGAKKLWTFRPGELAGDAGDEIGLLWGSSGSLTPSGTIDGVVFFEIQDA
jgi:hypothetical protein